MIPRGRRRASNNGLLFLILIVVLGVVRIFDRDPDPGRRSNVETPVPVTNPIEDVLRPAASVERREGIVAAILIDTSGSMREKVRDADGARRTKIEIAQRAALDLVNQFDSFAREHSDKTVYLGIYEFSDRGGQCCREVVQLGASGKSDIATVRSAVMNMRADGGTPIGDAMIKAKLDLDSTGLSKRHILVLTDGENNKGYSAEDVTRTITTQSEQDRASIYFVAFDIAEETFKPVRDAGGLVLAASNETELKSTLDYLLTGKILAEQPETPKR